MSWRKYLSPSQVTIFSKSYCPFCSEVKKLFDQMGVQAKMIQADQGQISDQDFSQMKADTGQNSVPNVWIGEKHLGGCDHTKAARSNGK
jgi:glutaredoxin